MPIVAWDGSLAVGHQMIDQHHEHLVELLNKSYDAFCERKSKQIVGAVLDELADYATYHFAQEGLLMQETVYPERGPHVAQHEFFERRIKEIQQEFLAGATAISLEVLAFLKNWLINHISEQDAALGAYAKGKPEKPVVIRLD